MIVHGDDTLVQWVVDRIPHVEAFAEPYTAVGVVRDGEVLAGAIYNNFYPPDIHVGFASSSPRWATKETIRVLLGWPFDAGCERITVLVKKSDQKTRRFVERLGFKMEGVHPKAFSGGSTGLSYGLYHDVYKRKWLNA